MRRLGLIAFGLVVACGAFSTEPEAAPASTPNDGGTNVPEGGSSSSGGPGPAPDAGNDADAPDDSVLPAVVQTKGVAGAANGTGATMHVTFDKPVASGHIIIASIVNASGTSNAIAKVEDDNGRSLKSVTTATNGSSASAEIWWTQAQGDVPGVTVTIAAQGGGLAVWLIEAVGVTTLGDVHPAMAVPIGDTVLDAPPVEVTTPSALVISTAAHGGEIKGIMPVSGFTNLGIQTTGGTITFATASRVVTAPGSYSARWAAQSSYQFNACTAAFTP